MQPRVLKLDRRARLFCVASQDGAGNGSGLERLPNSGSWLGSDSKVDRLSGWSNSDGEEEPINSKKKKNYGGKGSTLIFGRYF